MTNRMSSKSHAKLVAKWYQESYPLVACFQLYFLLTGIRQIVQIDSLTKREYQKIQSLLDKHPDLFSYQMNYNPKYHPFHYRQFIITRVNNAHLIHFNEEHGTKFARALNKDFYVCASDTIPGKNILRVTIDVVIENPREKFELLAQQCDCSNKLPSKKKILSVWKAYKRYQKKIQILLEACHLKGNSMLKFVYGKHNTYI
jgi:hypothetical protein